MDVRQKHSAPSRRQMNHVSLASNFDARYWMQALGVTRRQLETAVAAVGTGVEQVMNHLNVSERRLIVQHGDIGDQQDQR